MLNKEDIHIILTAVTFCVGAAALASIFISDGFAQTASMMADAAALGFFFGLIAMISIKMLHEPE